MTFTDETIKDLIAYSLKGIPGPEDWHITRTAMYRALKGAFKPYDGKQKQCLAISDSAWFGKILGLEECKYVSANYPEHNIIDLGFKDESFDFVISDQVMEHVEGNPFDAFKESFRVLKKGGALCHTTCFINPVHGVPKDFWRFTPAALQLMCHAATACEIITADGWGNPEAWALVDAGFRFAKIPNDEQHPLYKLANRNDPEWPIVTWVIARKSF